MSTIVYDKEICIRLYVKESYKYYQSRIEEGGKKGKMTFAKEEKRRMGEAAETVVP